VSGPLLWLGVALGGGVGALARFGLDGAIQARARDGFPAGTLVVNLSGAVGLGLLVGLALRHDARLLIGTAVLGSYTTFSTWMLETHRLAEDGRFRLAWANVALSLAAGLAAVWLGRLIGGGR